MMDYLKTVFNKLLETNAYCCGYIDKKLFRKLFCYAAIVAEQNGYYKLALLKRDEVADVIDDNAELVLRSVQELLKDMKIRKKTIPPEAYFTDDELKKFDLLLSWETN
jgi:hypothetical protein